MLKLVRYIFKYLATDLIGTNNNYLTENIAPLEGGLSIVDANVFSSSMTLHIIGGSERLCGSSSYHTYWCTPTDPGKISATCDFIV